MPSDYYGILQYCFIKKNLMRLLKLIALSIMFWMCFGCTLESVGDTLTYFACQDAEEFCEESILIDEILLSEDANSLFYFDKGDTLIFVNNQREELALKVNSNNNYVESIKANMLCHSCKNDSQYELYNVESSSVYFHLGDKYPELSVFSIKASTNRRHSSFPDTLLFFEEIEILAIDKKINKISLITNLYEVRGSFPANFTSQKNEYQFFNTITLQNQEFDNVYTNLDKEEPTLYFSFSKGLIGFELEGELWLFDRIK